MTVTRHTLWHTRNMKKKLEHDNRGPFFPQYSIRQLVTVGLYQTTPPAFWQISQFSTGLVRPDQTRDILRFPGRGSKWFRIAYLPPPLSSFAFRKSVGSFETQRRATKTHSGLSTEGCKKETVIVSLFLDYWGCQ